MEESAGYWLNSKRALEGCTHSTSRSGINHGCTMVCFSLVHLFLFAMLESRVHRIGYHKIHVAYEYNKQR